MKRIKILNYQVGLVFREGDFVGVLTEGTHWLWLNEKVRVYDRVDAFSAPIDLDIMLQNSMLASLLHVVEVKDNEIVLVYRNGNYKYLLTPSVGKYAFWKGIVEYTFQTIDLNQLEIEDQVERSILMRHEFRPYINMPLIEPYEQGLLIVEGQLERKLMPGNYYFWKNSRSIEVKKADMRAMQMEVSGQEILTKDKAALRVNFYLQYQIVDVEKALLETKDFAKQLYLLMQMAVREYVGTMSLDELLSKKEAIQTFVLEAAAGKATEMGIQLLNAGIRDIILPGEVREIMNQVLIAEKKAQANTIMRREETASTRSLLNTAKLMEDNAMLLKLKEMEYVERIAEKINSITVAGGGQIVEQLKEIFVVEK
ncbi:MAG: slipin family protein [Bacteroidota bacterium]